MIIPIRCFTCGKTLADKYDYYVAEVAKLSNDLHDAKDKEVAGPSEEKKKKSVKEKSVKDKEKGKAGGAPIPMQTVEGLKHFDAIRTGVIMDRLGLSRYCCRRHMMTTVDMMDTI